MNDYQKFIAYSRYSRWLPEENRRETWDEIVHRYIDWMQDHLKEKHDFDLRNAFQGLEKSIVDLEVMPSMRCLMTAGPALDRTHVAGYNCAYLVVDDMRAFDEAMYILLCGTGVGYRPLNASTLNNSPLWPLPLMAISQELLSQTAKRDGLCPSDTSLIIFTTVTNLLGTHLESDPQEHDSRLLEDALQVLDRLRNYLYSSLKYLPRHEEDDFLL